MPMLLHRADIDRRSSLLDPRYRPIFGKNATAANSFDNSMVNCRQRERERERERERVITVATYVATKNLLATYVAPNFYSKQAVETLTRIVEDVVERCRQLETRRNKRRNRRHRFVRLSPCFCAHWSRYGRNDAMKVNNSSSLAQHVISRITSAAQVVAYAD